MLSSEPGNVPGGTQLFSGIGCVPVRPGFQFKLCTASWLEWGGALSTKVFTEVCRKHGLQNQDG